MRYSKIDFQNFYNLGRVPSYAEGKRIPDAEKYFWRMNKGEIIQNAPIFDYFYLKSFDTKKYWEWKLCDAHKFTGEGSQIRGWFISEKLKSLLEQFNMSKPYYFYPSKLLYKREKLDYYIFQFTGKLIYEQTLLYVDYNKSIFKNPVKNDEIRVCERDEFLSKYDEIYNENKDLSKIIQFKKLVFNEDLDFFPIGTLMKDNIISERLKAGIEENGIEGFEFSELDYEVIVE